MLMIRSDSIGTIMYTLLLFLSTRAYQVPSMLMIKSIGTIMYYVWDVNGELKVNLIIKFHTQVKQTV